MKDYQHLIGSLLIAAAILAAGILIASALREAGGAAGSQIAAALGLLSP